MLPHATFKNVLGGIETLLKWRWITSLYGTYAKLVRSLLPTTKCLTYKQGHIDLTGTELMNSYSC